MAWVEARVRSIPKTDGGMRPITVAAAAWRLFAGEVVAELTLWTQQLLREDVTCVPGKGLDVSIQSFEEGLEEFEEGDLHVAGAAIDQSKCSDNICPFMAVNAAEYLGMPGVCGKGSPNALREAARMVRKRGNSFGLEIQEGTRHSTRLFSKHAAAGHSHDCMGQEGAGRRGCSLISTC